MLKGIGDFVQIEALLLVGAISDESLFGICVGWVAHACGIGHGACRFCREVVAGEGVAGWDLYTVVTARHAGTAAVRWLVEIGVAHPCAVWIVVRRRISDLWAPVNIIVDVAGMRVMERLLSTGV